MIYTILYFCAAYAHLKVATAIFHLYRKGFYLLAASGALTWLQIIRIAE